jgi:hypothetical protein
VKARRPAAKQKQKEKEEERGDLCTKVVSDEKHILFYLDTLKGTDHVEPWCTWEDNITTYRGEHSHIVQCIYFL